MNDADVQQTFHTWMKVDCPWYIVDEFLAANGLSNRAGAGPTNRKREDASAGGGDAQCANAATEESDVAVDPLGIDEEGACVEAEPDDEFQTEPSGATDEEGSGHDRDTHVLKMLYKGHLAEINKSEQWAKKARVYNEKHSLYKHTRCTSVAQEECIALPAGVFNVNEDSEDDEAYSGEQKEIAKKMDELRAAEHCIKQQGRDMAAEGRATSTKTGANIYLRLDWSGCEESSYPGCRA